MAVKKQNPDYYISAYYEGYKYLKNQNPEVEPDYEACMAMGRALIRSNKSEYGDIVYRPVDRRENYVKRCVGLPGDRLEIRNNVIYIDGEPEEELPGVQLNYYVQTDGKLISAEIFSKLGVSKDDYHRINPEYSMPLIQYLGMNPELPVYHFPMTREVHEKISQMPGVTRVVVEPYELGGDVFPLGAGTGWNRDNYGPVFIPAKGSVLRLNAYNFPIYERIIRVYERNELIVKDGKFFINGVETETYKFKMDYYWMMGDNRHNSADSRFWGFVPEDHVVGRPVAVWLSLNKDKGWFSGKIRFNRFFKDATR